MAPQPLVIQEEERAYKESAAATQNLKIKFVRDRRRRGRREKSARSGRTSGRL